MPVEKLREEEIIDIQNLYDSGMNYNEIEAKTGKGRGTISKYVKAVRVKPRTPAIPRKEVEQPPKQPEPLKDSYVDSFSNKKMVAHLSPATPPYPDVVEPYEWLFNFLKLYRFGDAFIQAQCSRVKMRKELPHPTDLMADMKEMQSGIKNLRLISFIADDYNFQVKKYMEEYQAETEYRPHARQGIPIGRPSNMYDRRQGLDMYGYPPQRDPYGRDQYGRDPYMNDGRQGIPVVSPPNYRGDDRLARLEDDIRRRDEAERTRLERELYEMKTQIAQGVHKNPDTERLERRMEQMEDERRRKQDEEYLTLKAQLRQAGGLSQHDVERLIERERDKLTDTDIRNIIAQEFASRSGLSEMDIKSQEIKSHHDIEMRKMDESGETRNVIAGAVQQGFGQIGQAIFRTAQEVGSDEVKPMPGATDGGEMWQAECPYCSSMITAPISADLVQCSSCGRELQVSGVEEKTTAKTMPRPRQTPPPERITMPRPRQTPPPEVIEQPLTPVPSESASFTVEQNIPSPPPKVEKIGICPTCGMQLIIPDGVPQIECPGCDQRFQVGDRPPIMPEPKVEQVERPLVDEPPKAFDNYPFQPGVAPPVRPSVETPIDVIDEHKVIPPVKEVEYGKTEAVDTPSGFIDDSPQLPLKQEEERIPLSPVVEETPVDKAVDKLLDIKSDLEKQADDLSDLVDKSVAEDVVPPRIQNVPVPPLDVSEVIEEETAQKEIPEPVSAVEPVEETIPIELLKESYVPEGKEEVIPISIGEDKETVTPDVKPVEQVVEKPVKSKPEAKTDVKPLVKKEVVEIGVEAELPHDEIKTDGLKEFVCDHPGCGKAFEKEMQLRGHKLHHIKRRGKSKKGKRKK